MKEYEVIIIGAGTAGLTARKEVAKVTDNYLVIDDGPLGTTCARVGCMPSKVLIQAANDFHRRKSFQKEGIHGAESLSVNHAEVLSHVRALRDRFTGGVVRSHAEWEHKLSRSRAHIVDTNTLRIGEEKVRFKKLIIATGSRPVIPANWLPYKDNFIDTNTFFELESFPKSMAVIGLGVIGLELGQALHRLGVEVTAFTMGKGLGGLTDPELQEYTSENLSKEMLVHYNGVEIEGKNDRGQLVLKADGKTYEVDKVLVSVGRKPNLDKLGFENLGIESLHAPDIDINTMQLKAAPHIFCTRRC